MIVRKEGMIEVYLQSPEGVIECIIQRIEYYGQEAFEVDFWRGMEFMSRMITSFSAGCIMQWDGQRYSIVSPKRYKNANDFWRNLEYSVGCHIEISS